MSRRSLAAGVVSLLFVTPSIAHAAFSYGAISYTDIADTFVGSPYTQLPDFPSINNGGQVAFSVLTPTFIQHVYVTPVGGGSLVNVADTTGSFNGTYSTSLNNAGVVAFSATAKADNSKGIYAGSGGALTTIANGATASSPYSTGATPRITDSGAASFLGTTGPSFPQIISAQGGVYTVVKQYDGHQFENFNDAAINNSGQVAFNTDDYIVGNNNGAFVYRQTGATMVLISRATSATSVGINDTGVVSFEASGVAGSGFPTIGIFKGDGTTTTAISAAGQFLPGTTTLIDGYGANNDGIPINNAGMVAFLGSDFAQTNYGIYVGDGISSAAIIRRGQLLFGKTVANFDLGRDSINDNGQVTFRVIFTDSTVAIVRSSGVLPVPEPATAALLLLASSPVLLRRRRTA